MKNYKAPNADVIAILSDDIMKSGLTLLSGVAEFEKENNTVSIEDSFWAY